MATEAQALKDLVFDKKYVYNKTDDVYVVFVKKVGKNIVVDGPTHRSMQRAYCGEDGREVSEICAVNDFPPSIFQDYKSVFGWTRDGVPISDEEVEDKSIEECVEDIIQHKKFEIIQEVNKRNWKDTEKDAASWRNFKSGSLDPFRKTLEGWSPTPRPRIKIGLPKKAEKSYMMTMTDWHIGAKLTKIHSFRKQEWNKEMFEAFFTEYLVKNLEKIKKEKSCLKEIVLLSLGDIMDGLRGETEKGTKLEQEFSQEEQFIYAYEICSQLIDSLREFKIPIKVYSLKGNHDGPDNYKLFMCLAKEFTDVEFHNFSERTCAVEFDNAVFLADHGAHDSMNAKIPTQKTPREAYINSLFLARPEILDNEYKYFIQGDLHHNEHQEFNDFEFIMVGSPARSLYSDANNWHSRSSQSSFLIGEDGIEDIFRFNFEKFYG